MNRKQTGRPPARRSMHGIFGQRWRAGSLRRPFEVLLSDVGGDVQIPPRSVDVNEAVRQHEITVSWDHRETAQFLHEWFDIFNKEFFAGALTTCFLTVDRARCSNLGHYRERNGVGARHEINLNTLYLERPCHEVLATLLHEMAHEWQELLGKPGKGSYHNKEFTGKCADLGIPCTGGYRSYRVGYGEPFISLLAHYGIAIDEQPGAVPESALRVPGSSKLKKWSCACTNVRAAVEVQARCLRCGQLFRRAE